MTIVAVTLRGVLRDRVFHGILVAALVFLAIPSLSTLSMRQVTELGTTLCLSLMSFILFLLAVFLGGVSLWKDIERRYTHSVLSLPMSRFRYLLGRFAGVAIFLFLVGVFLGIVAGIVVFLISLGYPPDRSLSWTAFLAAIAFDVLKCILLVSLSVLFSAMSTSFFLPIFGTISIYLVGGASQQAFEYVQSPAAQSLSPIVRLAATGLYYLLPNFSAFDLKVNAIYALPLDSTRLLLTVGYWAIYTGFVLVVAAAVFTRRELN